MLVRLGDLRLGSSFRWQGRTIRSKSTDFNFFDGSLFVYCTQGFRLRDTEPVEPVEPFTLYPGVVALDANDS